MEANNGTVSNETATNGIAAGDYITLISSDRFEFIICRETACISGTIKNMINPLSGFKEARGEVKLSNFDGEVLEKICEYLHYNEKWRGQENVSNMKIPPKLCLELMMAGDYLQL
jgi:transcription elongation factor B subunit 1